MGMRPACGLRAQRVFEVDDHVVSEDAVKRQINLGFGRSPMLTADGKVALIRGRISRCPPMPHPAALLLLVWPEDRSHMFRV